jgi:hypothetical protein
MAASVVIDASAVVAVVTNEAIEIAPVRSQASPLDVQGIDLGLSTEDIVSAIRERRVRESSPGTAG